MTAHQAESAGVDLDGPSVAHSVLGRVALKDLVEFADGSGGITGSGDQFGEILAGLERAVVQ